MAGGRGETGSWKVSGCVPDCDRLTFDCQHIRLHRRRRAGLWHEGKWIDRTQLLEVGHGRVGPEWATSATGRDADIRRRYDEGESQKRIAEFYEMTQGNVSRILNGNHQRPLGKYGSGGIKKPTSAELEAIRRYESQLLAGTWKADRNRMLGETDPHLDRSPWPHLPSNPRTGEPKLWFWGRIPSMHSCPY